MKYYYSDMQDSAQYIGPFDTLEEAKKAAEDEGFETYYIGEEDIYPIQPNGYSCLEYIAEDLDCNTYEDSGDDWYWQVKDKADELGDEIDELIRDFLKKKGISTTVTRIINIKEYKKG